MVKIDFVNATEPAINDTNLNQMQLNIENAINAQVSGDTLPVGCIVPFGSDTVPENWLLCNGQAVSRTDYALLFSIIGTTYGVGDGSTTFNLPNLKGRVAVGKDSTQTEFDNLGETGGEKTHTMTEQELVPHNHAINGTAYALSGPGSQEFGSGGSGSLDLKTVLSIGNKGGGQPFNVLQPYQVTNYIIKAKQSAGVVATVVDNLTSTSQIDALSANQGRVLNNSITTINNKFVYSSTETVIGTYMDKLLYRKTITTTAPQGGSSNYGIPHGISNLKAIIHQEINCTNNQGNTYPQHNDIYNFYIKDTDTQNVWCNVNSAFYNWTLIVVLEYTKTTD